MSKFFTKIFTLIAFATCLISSSASAQGGTTTYSNANYSLRRWDFGFNIGATWEQSDLDKNIARLGWGFTLGKYWLRNSNKVFDIGLRFRYLVGNARGQDYHRNDGLKYNLTFNDSTSATNYYSSPGYVYNNYKMISNEFSMELMLGANRLRQRTGILLYVFGGGGFFYSKTTTDQLNSQMQKYDYSTIDPASGNTAILNTLNGMHDGTYETQTEGIKNNGWVICPTLGIGIGKMLSKSTAIGLEHKITFPLHDYLDGQQWKNDNTATGTNDWQHYTGFYLRWYFRAHEERNTDTYTQHTDQTTYSTNNHDVNTNTNTNNNTGGHNPPPIAKPIITITYPNSNPYNSSSNAITVTGTVQNVPSRNEISVKVNGFNVNNFNYDPYTKAISISTMLNQGSNVVDIYATNNAGSDHASQYINYSDAGNFSGMPPVVTITTPGSNPYTAQASAVNVIATVTNVTSSNNISVTYNGVHVNNFSYDANTKILNYTANIVSNSNVLSITASNQYGVDTKSLTLNKLILNNAQKPIVTITYPTQNPYTVIGKTGQVTATVLNVEKGGISITANNVPVTVFTYSDITKVLTFGVNMNAQPTITVVITGTNNAGSDTKSTVLQQQPPKENPPVVTITSPTGNPAYSANNVQTVNATVQNVTSGNQVTVTVNNMPFPNFTYNNGQVSFNALLNNGSNTVTVSATNTSGTDSKSQTIVYQPKQVTPKPIVTITSPNTNPYSTSSSPLTLYANVQNVNSQSEINVVVNNSNTGNFTYSMSTHQLVLNTNLNPGSNTIMITAANGGGSDSKTETVIYTQQALLPPVVTITFPTSNPYEVHDANIVVTATVLNVTTQSQITVTGLFNAPLNFTFNPITHVVTIPAVLGANSNAFIITATNQAGTDSKNVTVKYTATSNNTGGVNHGGNTSSNPNPNNSGPSNTNNTQHNTGGKDNGNQNTGPKTTTTSPPKVIVTPPKTTTPQQQGGGKTVTPTNGGKGNTSPTTTGGKG